MPGRTNYIVHCYHFFSELKIIISIKNIKFDLNTVSKSFEGEFSKTIKDDWASWVNHVINSEDVYLWMEVVTDNVWDIIDLYHKMIRTIMTATPSTKM